MPPSHSKTAGDRVVHVDETAVEVLRRRREQQYQKRPDWMPAYDMRDDHGRLRLAFTREDEAPLVPRSVSRQFTMLAEQAGLGRRTLHGLRDFATSGQSRQQS